MAIQSVPSLRRCAAGLAVGVCVTLALCGGSEPALAGDAVPTSPYRSLGERLLRQAQQAVVAGDFDKASELGRAVQRLDIDWGADKEPARVMIQRLIGYGEPLTASTLPPEAETTPLKKSKLEAEPEPTPQPERNFQTGQPVTNQNRAADPHLKNEATPNVVEIPEIVAEGGLIWAHRTTEQGAAESGLIQTVSGNSVAARLANDSRQEVSQPAPPAAPIEIVGRLQEPVRIQSLSDRELPPATSTPAIAPAPPGLDPIQTQAVDHEVGADSQHRHSDHSSSTYWQFWGGLLTAFLAWLLMHFVAANRRLFERLARFLRNPAFFTQADSDPIPARATPNRNEHTRLLVDSAIQANARLRNSLNQSSQH